LSSSKAQKEKARLPVTYRLDEKTIQLIETLRKKMEADFGIEVAPRDVIQRAVTEFAKAFHLVRGAMLKRPEDVT
jgi:hypothetical protein